MKISTEKLIEVYNNQKQSLLRFAASIVKSPDLAEEIVQDVFVSLSIQEFEKIENHLKEWLLTVCRNKSIKKLKKEGRYTELFDNEHEKIPSEDRDPQETLILKEQCKKAVSLLKKLTPLQRKIMKLRFLKEHTNLEISKKLKMNNNTVAYHVSIASSRLRKLITK